MNQSNSQNNADDDLQFDVNENATATANKAVTCIACNRPIDKEYFALADKVVCSDCCAQLNAPPSGTKMGRFFKATLYGLGAGMIGALIWFAIRKIANIEVGLVAVLVGFMVGKAVRKGSGGRGGRGYQILAVALTYSCIAANYMPDVLQAFVEKYREEKNIAATQPADTKATQTQVAGSTTAPTSQPLRASASTGAGQTKEKKPSVGRLILLLLLFVGILFVTAAVAPFLAGVQNLIGLLIIGFALWEAWKLNRYRRLPITGPYQLNQTNL